MGAPFALELATVLQTLLSSTTHRYKWRAGSQQQTAFLKSVFLKSLPDEEFLEATFLMALERCAVFLI